MDAIPGWIRKRAYLAARELGPREYEPTAFTAGVIAAAIWSVVRTERKGRNVRRDRV